MEPTDYGIIGCIALTVMIMLGVSIFIAAGIVGFCGLWALRGFDIAVGISGHIPFSDTTNYALSVLPLFILIGYLAPRRSEARLVGIGCVRTCRFRWLEYHYK